MASNIPVIVQGNSFSLAIPLQIYYINGDQMDLQDYTPDPTDEVSVQLKGSRRNYTYTPTIDGNIANIGLTGNELADNYSVVVSVVKADGQRLRSFRTDQFFIVESSDDLTQADIIAGLEENVIYLNSSIFVAGADGRGIVSIVKTSTSGLVDTYTITYTDNTTSTFNVTNGAQGEAGSSIASIAKTGTSGLVDTYTITLTDGSTTTFEVTNGMNGVDLGLANIVNDLTTGGATNVLSAEMGKELNEKIEGVEVPDVYTFGGTSGYISINPITLADDGDAIEIDLKVSDIFALKAMSFATNEGRRAVTIHKNYVGVMSTDGFWLNGMNGASSQYPLGNDVLLTRHKVRLAKESGAINLYLDDVLKHTVSAADLGNKTVTIDKIGAGYSNGGTNYFWQGTIYGFTYTHNGVTTPIYELAGYAVSGDVTYTTKVKTNGIRHDVETLQDDVVDLQVDMGNVFETAHRTISTNISAVSGVVKLAGYNAAPDGNYISFSALASYDSYYFYTQEALDAWVVDNGTAYIAMCVINDAQPFANNKIAGTNPQRKRKSESNLPTSENPWSIPSGSAIAITVSAGKTTDFCNKATYDTFNGNTPLANEHIEQVIDALPSAEGKSCYVNVGSDNLDIFIPSASGYVKYVFGRSNNQTGYLDLWKMLNAYKCNDAGVEQLAITTAGEWEAAIFIIGRDDFMGGVHGDEIYTSIKCFADGALVDLATAQSGLKFNELRVLETSTMYDPADHTTQMATHTSEHVFTADGLVINQSIKWLASAQLGSSYMAMFPVAQAVSSAYCTDKDYTPVAIPEGGAGQINIYGVKSVNVWDEASGIFCVFGVERYVNTQDDTRHFLMHNNGQSGTYNKCYFFTSHSGDSVSANDIWKSTTIYKIMAGDV